MTQQTNSKTGKKTMWILIAAAAAVLVALVLCYVLFADNKDKDPASDQNPGDIGDISYTENIESSGDDVISSVNDDTLPDENIVSGDLQADEDVPGNMDTVPESEANDDPELSSSGSGTAAKPVNVTSQPCPGRERCGKEGCYWCTPMDISDEDAVWKMLCSPITVISGDQRKQYQLRSKPNRNSTPVGDVTCESQGVHVLETLDTGWTRVETYSSSFDDSKVWANNMLVTGYVETRLLKEVKPNNSNYGLVIDKMTQRCYIFRNGKLFSILRVSTGKPNEYEPYNETQSGEFLIVCAVGNFVTEEEGLVCDMALRFNRGNMLHQVPYTLDKDENKNFDIYEAALGTRASHGCIR
ncbi:MAG: hypothetical protein CW338_10865, partial [Clostridiales bacterium]|nr:hypothetical protein [Clostridiales bacterium]